jgi:hypothetical protein
MKKSISFDIGFFILENGIRTELLRALMAMKQKSVASEEKFLSPEILGEKESHSLRTNEVSKEEQSKFICLLWD